MKQIFLNLNEGRLKTGWRLLVFIITFWLFAATIFLVKPIFGSISNREFLENYTILIVSILAISASISVFLIRNYIDKKTVVSLGLKLNKQSVKDLLFGFVLSGAMAALFFFTLLAFNLIEFNQIHFETSIHFELDNQGLSKLIKTFSTVTLLIVFVEHVLVGYWEELVFRGYVFQNLVEGIGIKLSILISCLTYGLIHAFNPNAGVVSILIIILFGYLRIYGYLSTRMLWLSIGMHVGWNFFQGPIFGFAASGNRKASLINHTLMSHKNWLTGGEFGPEGSVIIIPIILITILVMKKYVSSRSISEL